MSISAEHRLQLSTYAMITPEASGLWRLDTVTNSANGTRGAAELSSRSGRPVLCRKLYSMVQSDVFALILGYWRECRECERGFGRGMYLNSGTPVSAGSLV